MKAIVLDGFGGVEHFRLIEMVKPVIQENEVLIRIKAAAFNPIDYQMRQGRREKYLMTSPILGRELSGIITAVGSRVSGFSIGDEVIAASGSKGSNGSYAEYMSLNPQLVALKPANASFEQAAAIPSSGLTAWQSFSRMKISKDQSIFIAGGAGAVGSFLIRLLKQSGIDQVLSTAGSPESTGALLALGLREDQIINYKSENLKEHILNANGGQTFDFAVDLVGARMSELAAEVLKVNGTYLDVTFLGTEKAREQLFDKGCMIINISNYAYTLNDTISWYGATLSKLSALIENNEISVPAINIVGELGLETVRKAHLLMENNQIYGMKQIMSIS